jgi:hypothetical protein
MSAWVSTVSTCGHCLLDFYGPIGSHVCGERAKAARALNSGRAVPRKFTGPKATESLANALASSPTFRVELDALAIVDLAVCHELAHGEHLTATSHRERQRVIAQAARDFAAYRAPMPATQRTGSAELQARAKLLLGFGITVERALATAPAIGRNTLRSLVAEEVEMVRRWRDTTTQEKCG